MEFRILGPLEARSEGLLLPLGGPRQRALLAYLLLYANQIVSTERLLDEVWFDPPLGGAAAVQTQISRLRKVFGDRLVSSGQGYSLHVEPDELDLDQVRGLLADAGAAPSPRERSLVLRESEKLWRGEPLSGLEAPFVPGEAAALDELRYGALEERFAADLERGCAAELLAEISLLVAQQPLRERLRMQQILALYRAGRQAEALDAYRNARSVLDEELGLEPSPALRELERAILRHDPELDPPPPPPDAPAARAPRRRRTVVAASLLCLTALVGGGTAVLVTHTSHRAASPKTVIQHRATHTKARRSPTSKAHPIARAVIHARKKVQPQIAASTSASVLAVPTVASTHAHPAARTQPAATTKATTTTSVATRRTATISDDFAGTQIDSTIWYQSFTGTGWTLSQQNGYVEFSFGAGAQTGGQYAQVGGHLGSQCKFPGDFDARVDFSLPQWPAHNGVIVNLWAFFSNVGYAAWRQSSPQWGELFGSYTGPNKAGGVQLDDASGSLRLARHDGLLTAYFLHKGGWNEVTSSQEAGLATIGIGANAGTDFGGQPVVVDLSNFTVTGDNPVCPPGSHPTGG